MFGSRPEPEEVTASAGTSSGSTVWEGVELSAMTASLAATTWAQRVPSSASLVHWPLTAPLSAERLVAPERISEYWVLTLLVPSPLEGRGWNHFRSGFAASSGSSGFCLGRL